MFSLRKKEHRSTQRHTAHNTSWYCRPDLQSVYIRTPCRTKLSGHIFVIGNKLLSPKITSKTIKAAMDMDSAYS